MAKISLTTIQRNKELYYHGFKAKLPIVSGMLIIFIGFLIWIIPVSKNNFKVGLIGFIVMIIFFIWGVKIIIKDLAKYFDFQRKSRIIIHKTL